MQHGGAAERGGQPGGEGRLPGARVPVDADQPDRPAGGRQPAQEEGEIVDGGS
jgi:hypothetical protein